MRDRCGQFNMPHPLTANLGQSDLNAAFLTDNAPVLHPLIFTAQTFIIADRAKDAGTKQAVFLWLEGTIVDGFRLLDLTKRPGSDPFW